ncbi:hypothetical protein BKE38_17665 [Pseudoroseomonas deserti]|uniref:Uncharacterized protein n=1 Tax=Teichococcus deserti TaxID=1817963 RepID=A0A1V2GZF1_9PROT|nr:hypothetical protein [Pseudoroseomonas deserti]ONG50643.1 hypothetical protein BKE38_17665 [Pseudoroseomonas deserti]
MTKRFAMMGLIALGAAATLAATAGSSAAQPANTCAGKMFIDTVYANGTGPNAFEYFVQIRNQTSGPMIADVALGGFPQTVTLFSPRLPGVPTGAWQSQQIRFGRGTNAQINPGTVDRLYDRTGSGKPYISLQNCRAG